MDPVPGRACGTCTICCKEPLIDDPMLKKHAGVLCEHCVPGGGCNIYEALPQTCADFYCGYRLMPDMGEDWRPDRSGVLVSFIEAELPPGFSGPALKFDILKPKALKWDGLLVYLGGLIASGQPVFLSVPGPPGHNGIKFFLNQHMRAAVASRNRARLIAELGVIYDAGVRAPKSRAALSA